MSAIIKKRNLAIFVFGLYSMLINLFWILMDLLPMPLRRLLLKIAFGNYGAGGLFDYRCFVRYPWKIKIGSDVDINRGCQFYPSMQTRDGEITIHDNAVLGPNVTIFTATHDYTHLHLPDKSAPVIIGKHVWVGGNVTILPGVTIGEGAVVGAGSVVTSDIQPYSIYAGNPARFLKKRVMQN